MRCFFLLILLISVKYINCCVSKNITADIDEYQENYNDNVCQYIIEAHPSKAIHINTYVIPIDVWLQFEVDGVQNEINIGYKEISYTSPIGVGIRLNTSFYQNVNIGLRMKRIENPDKPCSFPLIVVGVNSTIIQEHREIENNNERCAYRLVPDNSLQGYNEILLEFEEKMSYEVRRHQNGTISEIESEKNSKLFPIGTIDFLLRNYNSQPRISTRLVHISCDCGNTTFDDLTKNDRITIRSPGYPNGNCPLKTCTYKINCLSKKSEKLYFNINTELATTDHLRVVENIHKGKSRQISSSMSFEVDTKNYEIQYSTSAENIERTFEINVTRVSITKNCGCSSDEQKTYDSNGRISFVIPKSCQNVFCHWKLQYNYWNPRIIISMLLGNPSTNDRIYLNDKRFNGSELIHENMYSMKNKEMIIDFQRYNSINQEDTQLDISWVLTSDCQCPNNHISLDGEFARALTSPNYPDEYCSNGNCLIELTAPNNTYIELTIVDFELENFHDFLQIYDEKGNTLAKLTGEYSNHVIVSSTNNLKLNFNSDGSHNFKGYYIRAIAKEKIISSSYFPTFTILSILVTLVIIALLVGLWKYGLPRKLSNGVVQFTNHLNGSSASINLSSI